MLGYIILSKNLFPFPNILDQMVYTVRYRCGQQLAIEAPVDADLVSTVPESATPAALGYATKVFFSSLTHSALLI